MNPNNTINAIIVDDEPFCCEALATLLDKYCPGIQVLAECNSGKEALVAIQEHKPQLIFLDIEMPQMNGFDLLEKIKDINFEIIFTTSFDQYAIQAIRFSALDYLLKPIDREELLKAVKRVESRLHHSVSQQLEVLFQKIKNVNHSIQRIALPTMEGLQLIALDTIISCASDSNYTAFHLKEKKKIVVSRTLKEVEEMLEEFSFLRVHNSYIVNLNEISKYMKGDGGYLTMSDGSVIVVSRSRKEILIKRLYPVKD